MSLHSTLDETERAAPPDTRGVNRPIAFRPILVVATGLLVLLACCAISLISGNFDGGVEDTWNAVFHYRADDSYHQIIWELRLPRMLAAVAVGACLAVSGALMQGLTRNPLADPSILGVTQGATLAMALALALAPGLSNYGLMFFSFAGAGAGAGFVILISMFARNGMTPVRLVLAGMAMGTLLSSLATAIAIHYDVARILAFWFAGGVAGVSWNQLDVLWPACLIGVALSIMLARSVTLISLDESVAQGLGSRLTLARIGGTAAVLLLTGAAVSIAGAISFAGLLVPHACRKLVGFDYRFIIPCAAVFGALLLVVCDICTRMIYPPYETPVSILTSVVGAPVLLYIARRQRS